MPRDRHFETTFGELMAQEGVKKLTRAAPAKPAPAPPAPPPSPVFPGRGGRSAPRTTTAPVQPAVDIRQEDPHQTELRQLLQAANELREQRGALREALTQQEKQLEHHITEKADLRTRLREMEALRHTDMALITQLRKDNTALQEANAHLTLQQDKLQRALRGLQARLSTPPAPPQPQPAPPEALAVDPIAALGEDEGSDLRRAAFGLASACRAAGVQRIVVVGGSPVYRQQLRDLLGAALELRLIGGQERRTLKQARADIAWGDVVLVWGGTILDHSLSQLYQGETVRVVPHRGLAGMLRLAAEGLGPPPA